MKKVTAFLKVHWVTIVLIFLLVSLTVAIKYFIYSFEQSFIEGELHRPEIHRTNKRVLLTDLAGSSQATSGGITLTNTHLPVSTIQAWMTFDYVNVVYKLPTNYIKDILGINDPKYPNVRIDTYAKESNINQKLLLDTVQHYVSTYQNQ